MPKVTLAEGWVYAGKRYGPGEVELADLPDGARDALGKKGAFGEGPVADAAPAAPSATATPQANGGNEPPADPLVEAVGAEAAQALRDLGIGDLAAIRAASDDDLLAVPGIGEAKLKKLRALGE